MTTDRNCLDAETVAAWMDGGLDAAGVAAAEAHASNCERCQALLATVVRTMPASSEAHIAPGFSRGAPARLWKWWFAPLAATAAAVTIWMVVPQRPMQPSAATQIARDTAEESARAQQPPPAEFAPQVPPPAATAPTRDNSRRNLPAASNQAQNKVADAAADTSKLDAEALGRKDAQGKREEGKALAEMRQAAESAAAPPAAVAAGASAERMREASSSAREQSSELRRDKPAAPSIGAVSQLRKQASTPTVVSPDPNSRWRIIAGGTIERSEDGGRIWIPVRRVPSEEVLAGASPGRLVAWLVGRNGLVLLATDGTNFTRLPFPESVDLVSVSSPEPRIAIITTADGRTFRTEDAGRNWRNP